MTPVAPTRMVDDSDPHRAPLTLIPREPSENEPQDITGTWRGDLKAGLVVFLVALPLCLGVALASGAPLMGGIITGIVGGVVVSRLSGSQLMVSGPAAGLTAVVSLAILSLGSYPRFLAAVVLAGALQLVLWRLRAGIVAYFFPSSVIKGMLAAIGITLIVKQLPYALGAGIGGADVGRAAEGASAVSETGALDAILKAAQSASPTALFISAIALGVLLMWDAKRFARLKALLPAPLVVVLLGLALALGASFTGFALPANALVSLPVDEGPLSMFTLPALGDIFSPAVMMTGVTIALVASLETLLSLEATDKLDPLKRQSSANRELMAQGTGNMLAGLLGGLPMTGVIVRSAANVDAGGKTWRSSFTHGLLLAISVITIAPLLNRIPLAALAVILIYTGFKLAHPKALRSAVALGPHYYVPFIATIAAILATDLLKGVVLGLLIGAVFVLYESYSHGFSFQRKESADHHRITLYLAEQVTFLNRASISNALESLPNGCVATVDGNRTRYIDPDVVQLLHEFKERALIKNVAFHLVAIPEPHAALAHH